MSPTPEDRGPSQELSPAAALLAGLFEEHERVDDARLDELCAEHPALASELRELFAAWRQLSGVFDPRGRLATLAEHDPELTIAGEPPGEGALPAGTTSPSRYRVGDVIGRGGMGVVRRVWDGDLRRALAMKVLRGDPPAGDADPDDADRARRFLTEAQVTGQLEHPGVVPVHEVGVDVDGRLYFTMRLVRGRDLDQIFRCVASGEEGWTRTRALSSLLRVCETMAFAHDRGVIHRDLKPQNVMVGRFGETYVMDWGLARVVGSGPEGHERIAEAPEAEASRTLEGSVVGTPSYMPPEQARGELARLGPPSDVYCVGAMLYELCAGRRPYDDDDVPRSAAVVVRRILAGPPAPLASVADDVPAELAAICDKAMAREPEERYADMGEMATDLRAFLEGHVVRAYETGAVAELRKWIGRNRALAGAIAAGVLVALAGLGTVGAIESQRRREVEERNLALAVARAEADEQARLATERAERVLRLSDLARLDELERRAETLWPPHPALAGDLEAWLADAYPLVARLDDVHRATLTGMRDARSTGDEEEPRFETTEAQWEHDTLVELVTRLDALAAEDGRVADVERRLELAARVETASLSSDDARARWAEAARSIADPFACPRYTGLVLEPQVGLLPLGRNAQSGLWEFAHVLSGNAPEWSEDGGAAPPTEGSAIVLVLVPSGELWVGAQNDDPNAPGYCRDAKPDEGPPHRVGLSPFFVSKFEMTQDQWQRWTGSNPSAIHPLASVGGLFPTVLHPVENVRWSDAVQVLRELGLVLPTEAQWEYAALGGVVAPWPTGPDERALDGYANLRDFHMEETVGIGGLPFEEWLDDGYVAHAPCGIYAPNGFGLHDVVGNVQEWARDNYSAYAFPNRPGDGLRLVSDNGTRASRGGSYFDTADTSRVSVRAPHRTDYSFDSVGVRPARAVD